MVESKSYKVIGKITKPNFKTNFQKEVKASKPEDAIEAVYKILGSKHRVKRFQIIVDNVEELVSAETQ